MLDHAPPKVFTTAAVFKLHAYNILLGIPVFLSLLLVSLIRLQFISFVIPLIALAATIYFLPLGLGNPYVARLARLLRVEARPDALLVQLTLFPRIRSGLRAVVEDADDIGFVRFTDTELVFEGDSLRLVLPYEQIAEVHPHNVGLRGSFLYGRRIELSLSGLENVEGLEFAERSSWVLPTSKRITRELYQKLTEKVRPARRKE